MFVKYPEIENSYQEGFIAKIKEQGYGKIPYVVTEKIHGGNSQISYDIKTGEFKCGKRTAVLAEDEVFYNIQEIMNGLQEQVKNLADDFAEEMARYGQIVASVTIFGEIFGGLYPHECVIKDKHALKVQKGVYYAPSNQWLPFDIAYTIEGSDRTFFVSLCKAFNMCTMAGLDFVPVLAICKNLDEALQFANDKTSEVYLKYHLPEIKDNIMEGVVIRPYMKDIWMGDHRVILKNKNDKFKEKSRAKKDEISEEVPEAVQKACEEISQYINMNRVRNVISHMGEVTPKDIGKVIMETSKDVLADYQKEYNTLSLLEKKEEKMVTKYMNGEVAKVVRDVIIFGR